MLDEILNLFVHLSNHTVAHQGNLLGSEAFHLKEEPISDGILHNFSVNNTFLTKKNDEVTLLTKQSSTRLIRNLSNYDIQIMYVRWTWYVVSQQ